MRNINIRIFSRDVDFYFHTTQVFSCHTCIQVRGFYFLIFECYDVISSKTDVCKMNITPLICCKRYIPGINRKQSDIGTTLSICQVFVIGQNPTARIIRHIC